MTQILKCHPIISKGSKIIISTITSSVYLFSALLLKQSISLSSDYTRLSCLTNNRTLLLSLTISSPVSNPTISLSISRYLAIKISILTTSNSSTQGSKVILIMSLSIEGTSKSHIINLIEVSLNPTDV